MDVRKSQKHLFECLNVVTVFRRDADMGVFALGKDVIQGIFV